MKIVVTGGAGFIGSHLVTYFVNRGDEVTVYDDFSRGTNALLSSIIKKIRLKKCDVSKPFRMSRVDIVYHLAADSLIENDNAHSYERNVKGTLNVLEQMRETGTQKIVFSSSASVYGGNKNTVKPLLFYGASKVACEHLMRVYKEKYALKYWIYRFGNVVGSGMNHGVIYDFLHHAKQFGEIHMHGDGSQMRSYIHVEDLLKALVTSDERRCGIYDVASEDYASVMDIAETISTVLKKKLLIKHYPRWQGDADFYSVNSDRLKATGWKATMNSLQAIRKATEELSKEI